jgi:hypothetical protein
MVVLGGVRSAPAVLRAEVAARPAAVLDEAPAVGAQRAVAAEVAAVLAEAERQVAAAAPQEEAGPACARAEPDSAEASALSRVRAARLAQVQLGPVQPAVAEWQQR